MLAFAFFSSALLFIIMVWCLVLKSPYVVKRIEAWSKKQGGGLSMINACQCSSLLLSVSTDS